MTVRNTRRPDRVRQIADVLVRHGLGFLVGVLGLERFVPFHRGILGHPRRAQPYTRPEHLRMALEELGGAWVKLGQILSTRADLVPPDYQAELAKLQDAAPPVPPEAILPVFEAELGQPPEKIFAYFDWQPLAAASIGQAHAAVLPDGTEVVVKVRRPGIVEQVEQDLEILLNLAHTASRRWELAEEYDLVGLAEQFAQTLRAELDYLREGRNAETFARNFRHDPTVHIPRIFWDTTTSRVLTIERVRGIKVNDLPALEAAGVNRTTLAERAAHVLLKMVFEDGFFHADPHPGNLFVEADGRLGLIDFGMVGYVDERTQDRLAALLMALTAQDADRLVDAFIDLGITGRRVDREGLRRDLSHIVFRYYGRPIKELAVGPILTETLEVSRRHRLHMPANLALLIKTVMMAEGLAIQLDPDFRLTTVLVPYTERLVLRRYSPLRWARRLGAASLDAAELGVELPHQLRRLLGAAERGDLQVGVRPERFGPLLGQLERMANRIVLGILVSAFIIGLAVLMAAAHPPGVEGLAAPAFGVGFVLAALLGIYLALAIFRSGRA